jgi:hypothetical protein
MHPLRHYRATWEPSNDRQARGRYALAANAVTSPSTLLHRPCCRIDGTLLLIGIMTFGP